MKMHSIQMHNETHTHASYFEVVVSLVLKLINSMFVLHSNDIHIVYIHVCWTQMHI